MSSLRIGLIGLDTSHAPAFAQLLNDDSHPHHIAGGRVVAAFAGGSPDFPLSRDRVEGFTDQVQNTGEVELLVSPAAVAAVCDAILLTSVDGRVHLDQLREIAPFGKPVFVDKPFAITSRDARSMVEIARQHQVPLMSCSSLRFAAPLVEALEAGETLVGGDFSGPMSLEPTQPGFFWYGIHVVEMLYAAFGAGCESVVAESSGDFDVITARWRDGRLATVRGNRNGKAKYGALLHSPTIARFVDVSNSTQPLYATTLRQIMDFFHSQVAPIAIEETLEIVRFLEAANQSLRDEKRITL